MRQRTRLTVPAVRHAEWPVRVGHPGGRGAGPGGRCDTGHRPLTHRPPTTDAHPSSSRTPIPSAPAHRPALATMSAHGMRRPAQALGAEQAVEAAVLDLAPRERRVTQVELRHVAALEPHCRRAPRPSASDWLRRQSSNVTRGQPRARERREVEPAAADRDVRERRVGEGDARHPGAADLRRRAGSRAAPARWRGSRARSARPTARAPRASTRRATRRSCRPSRIVTPDCALIVGARAPRARDRHTSPHHQVAKDRSCPPTLTRGP